VDTSPAGADGWRRFTLTLNVRDGWHLAAETEGQDALKIEGIGVELECMEVPVAAPLVAGEGPVGVVGSVVARGRMKDQLGATRRAIRLRYQPCSDDRCLPAVALELQVQD
jgi:hypothetical protein